MGEVRSLTPEISVGHRGGGDVATWVNDAVLRRGLAFSHQAKWHTEKRLADLPPDTLIAGSTSWYGESAALLVRGMLVHVFISTDDSVHTVIYAERHSAGDFEAAVAQLKAWLTPKAEPVPEEVVIGFRYLTMNGPRYRQRTLRAPSWSEIAGNYADSVRDAVTDVAEKFRPGAGGRLVLFHGPPGTGKTYVIRALAREWAKWCRFEYITDPEKFFGDADYMMHVLIEGHSDSDDDDEDEGADRWRILVLEDAGELLARDAKMQQGQGLSRLLNFAEGLLGQGLNVMTLITTNEKLSALNEAVARPGRTAVEIEFAPLSVAESNAWLAANDPERRTVSEELTLAELYALVAGHRRTVQEKPPLGLRR